MAFDQFTLLSAIRDVFAVVALAGAAAHLYDELSRQCDAALAEKGLRRSGRCSGYAVDVRLLIAARGYSEQAQSGSARRPSSERFLTHGGNIRGVHASEGG